MKWTVEELESMALWDAAIEAEGWTAEDESAAEDIAQALLQPLFERRLLEVLPTMQIPERQLQTVYVAEKRPMKGRRKSKGNVAAQKARWYARQKLKKTAFIRERIIPWVLVYVGWPCRGPTETGTQVILFAGYKRAHFRF